MDRGGASEGNRGPLAEIRGLRDAGKSAGDS
jgi:hypothetical protein